MNDGDFERLQTLSETLTRNQRLLGMDLGTKTIGLALSDAGRSIATAWQTVKRSKFQKDADTLLSLCDSENIGGLVLGLPLNMDGSEGPRSQATRAFARNLATRTDLPLAFWDERLSTIAAERVMIEADMSRKKRAQKIDAAAAAFILQGALDRLQAMRRNAQTE